MAEKPKSRTVKPNGETITRLRIEKGWRIEDLAKKAGCSVKTVENVEWGAEVYLLTLRSFAEALGVEYGVLVSGHVPPEPPKTLERFEMKIHLSIPMDGFDQSKQLISLMMLLRKLFGDDNIDVVRIQGGSTIITITLTEEEVKALGKWTTELRYRLRQLITNMPLSKSVELYEFCMRNPELTNKANIDLQRIHDFAKDTDELLYLAESINAMTLPDNCDFISSELKGVTLPVTG